MYCSNCGTHAPDDGTLCTSCGLALQVNAGSLQPRPEVSVVPQVVHSGFWRRACAAGVDIAVQLPFFWAFEYTVGLEPFGSADWSPKSWTIQGVEAMVGWLYSARLESSGWQGTLGQQLFDVRVCDLSGRRVTFARATGRHFGQYLSLLTLGFGFLMIAFTARKQALHDRLAGCLVVRREPETTRTWPGRPPKPGPAPPGAAVPGLGA